MKKQMSKRKTLAVGIALASVMTASLAQAGPMISEWFWVNEAGFLDDYAPSSDVTASGDSGDNDWYTTLAWGTPVNPSSSQSTLFVGDGTTGTTSYADPGASLAETNGAATFGTNLTHDNFVITGPSLTSATLRDRLWLQPAMPAGPEEVVLLDDFYIAFNETPNRTGSGDICLPGDGGNEGSGINLNGCGDVFVVKNPDALVQVFNLDGWEYTVTIGAAGLGVLSDEACDSVGESTGCVGWVTGEEQSNVLNPFFTITAKEIIPEPATIALLGVGLAGIGGMMRRRRKNG